MKKYIHYVLENEEPFRVSDDAVSQSGQTSTLKKIPGSAIRGIVVNAFSAEKDFEEIKLQLFSEPMIYTDALLKANGRSLIPSPKGFYEDKAVTEGKKIIENVVRDGNFSEGMKRASLGSFCYVEDGCIHYYQIPTMSDMKLLINYGKGQKRNVFRLECVPAGYLWEGYIRLSGKEEIDARLKALFQKGNDLYLGNGRSSGLGKCRVSFMEEADQAFPVTAFAASETEDIFFDADQECYMMLLSDTVMRDANGELCGLNLEELGQSLGVQSLEILFSSTSTRRVHGYNRTWGSKLPAFTAYEAGSVFHLKYSGVITREKMKTLCENGIGIRRNEGFGRILFLRDYEGILSKQAEEYSQGEEENLEKDNPPAKKALTKYEMETLRTAASNYYRISLNRAMERYVVNHPIRKKGLKNSQIGAVESRLLRYKYNPEEAEKSLEVYFGHVEEKEKKQRVQQKRDSLSDFALQVRDILKKPLEETLHISPGSGMKQENASAKRESRTVMGLPLEDVFSEKDEAAFKMELLIQMIRYDRKKEG